MNPGNFLAELKRRNVYKVAVAYAVVAWLLIQAASILFPTFEAPPWIMKVFVAIVALGFPVALVIAWAFESSPKGIDRTMIADALNRHSRGRAWIYVVVIGALLSVALFFLGRFSARNSVTPQQDAIWARSHPPTDKSIAVLPFDNLSRDPDNAFFAEGVQDEILTDLAKVADLKVISRTSVMQYKDAAARNLREIGRQLGVAHLLEGSVQRAAGKVRVNAQLIDARNDAHVWAQTYDRDLADVFAIQSEIAQTIAEQLRARLSPAERAAISQPPTTDVVANDLYVRAQALDYQANDPGAKEGLLEGVRLLEEAVKRDPNFLLAYCLLCEINLDIYWGAFDHTDARREQANRALQRAEQIRPDAGEVHLQKGAYAYHGFRDYERARIELELARRLLPNSGQLYTYLAAVDRRQARWDDAIRNFARACELDPRNVFIFEESSFTHFGLKHFAELKSLMDRALTLDPTNVFIRAWIAQAPYAERADTASWRSQLNTILSEGKKRASHVAFMFVMCALAERDRNAATQALDLVPADGAVDYFDSAWPRV